jgi:hypothetical protein
MARTVDNGYGAAHRKLRKRWEREVALGGVVCHRPGCGRLIHPLEPWDLGHDDVDRSRYHGPEHRECNRATQGRGSRRKTSENWLEP